MTVFQPEGILTVDIGRAEERRFFYSLDGDFQHILRYERSSTKQGDVPLTARSASNMGWSSSPTMTKVRTVVDISQQRSWVFAHQRSFLLHNLTEMIEIMQMCHKWCRANKCKNDHSNNLQRLICAVEIPHASVVCMLGKAIDKIVCKD